MTDTITIRLTPAQRAAIEAAAGKVGLRAGQWMREQALRAAGKGAEMTHTMTDGEIAYTIGAEDARSALAAGCDPEPHSGEVSRETWQALEGRLGRSVYGYGEEGSSLARAVVEGYNETMGSAGAKEGE